jgi:hypothetical protein
MRDYSQPQQPPREPYRRPKSIIEWKRTPGQFVAILESLEQFEARSIRELQRRGPETILVGRRRDTEEDDWYALAYSRNDLEFDEARDMARAALERWRAGETT